MNAYSPFGPALAGLGIIMVLFYVALLVISIYSIVLFIRVGHRGIKALDIYIRKNSQPFNPAPPNYTGGTYYTGQTPSQQSQQINKEPDYNKE